MFVRGETISIVFIDTIFDTKPQKSLLVLKDPVDRILSEGSPSLFKGNTLKRDIQRVLVMGIKRWRSVDTEQDDQTEDGYPQSFRIPETLDCLPAHQ